MPHLPRFQRFVIPVTDIDHSVAFYEAVLGMDKVFDNGNPVRFVILEGDGAELHVTLAAGHRASSANVCHLPVDDSRSLGRHLQARGVRTIKGIRRRRLRHEDVRVRRSRRQPHRRGELPLSRSPTSGPASPPTSLHQWSSQRSSAGAAAFGRSCPPTSPAT
jgi:catechol 2,3-dioxygenase-like lactoylglutathione lyase family enzyme